MDVVGVANCDAGAVTLSRSLIALPLSDVFLPSSLPRGFRDALSTGLPGTSIGGNKDDVVVAKLDAAVAAIAAELCDCDIELIDCDAEKCERAPL
jgi:hypothetical protein